MSSIRGEEKKIHEEWRTAADRKSKVDEELSSVNTRLQDTLPRRVYDQVMQRRAQLVREKAQLERKLRELKPEVRRLGDALHSEWKQSARHQIRELIRKYDALAGKASTSEESRAILRVVRRDLSKLRREGFK